MIRNLAKTLTVRAVKNGSVDQANSDIYIYGAELMISGAFGILIALSISFLAGALPEGVAFILVFAWLRRYTGGHHADTYAKCIGTFTVLILVALSAIIFIPEDYMALLAVFFLTSSLIATGFIAPVEHRNKPIPDDKKSVLRRKSLILCGGLSIVAVLGMIFFPKWTPSFFSMALSVFFVGMSAAYASHINSKERAGQNEKNYR